MKFDDCSHEHSRKISPKHFRAPFAFQDHCEFQHADVLVNTFLSGELSGAQRTYLLSMIKGLTPYERTLAKHLALLSSPGTDSDGMFFQDILKIQSDRRVGIYFLMRLMSRVLELADE